MQVIALSIIIIIVLLQLIYYTNNKNRFQLALNIFAFLTFLIFFTTLLGAYKIAFASFLIILLFIEYRIFLGNEKVPYRLYVSSVIYLALVVLGIHFGLKTAANIAARILSAFILLLAFIKNFNIFYLKRNRSISVLFATLALAFIAPFLKVTEALVLIVLLEIAFFNYFIVIRYIRNLKGNIQFNEKERKVIFKYMEDSAVSIFSQKGIEKITAFVDSVAFELITDAAYCFYALEYDELVPLYVSDRFPPVFPVSDQVLKKAEHIKETIMKKRIKRSDFFFEDVLKTGKYAIYKNPENLAYFKYLINSPVALHNIAIFPMTVKEEVAGVFLLKKESDFTQNDIILGETLSKQIGVFLYSIKMKDALLTKERMERELNMSKQIQESLLPHVFPDNAEVQVYGELHAAREMGGDYFDVIEIEDGVYDLVVADVSGKGIPAALLMVILRTLIRIFAKIERDPHELVVLLNNILIKDISENMFITLIYGRYYSAEHRFVYCSAGHDNPICVKAAGKIDVLPIDGIALGMIAEISDIAKQFEYTLSPGDKLFFYTDGVTEAKNKDNEFFGLEQTKKFLLTFSPFSAKEIVKEMYDKIMKFSDNAVQYDDITMLCMKVNK